MFIPRSLRHQAVGLDNSVLFHPSDICDQFCAQVGPKRGKTVQRCGNGCEEIVQDTMWG